MFDVYFFVLQVFMVFLNRVAVWIGGYVSYLLLLHCFRGFAPMTPLRLSF